MSGKRPQRKRPVRGWAHFLLASLVGNADTPAPFSCRVVTYLATRLPDMWSLSARTLSCIGLCPDRRYGDDLLWIVMWAFFFHAPWVVGIPTDVVRERAGEGTGPYDSPAAFLS